MKTLLITYLPRGERSNTRKLLDVFLSQPLPGELERLDLVADPPPLFDTTSLPAYINRNYRKQTLSPAEAESLRRQDALIAQLKTVDIVVMAYPMHNFAMPASIKAYFDAVMFHGETFTGGPNGSQGLLTDKRALTLFTSGGVYPADQVTLEYPNWDTLTVLARIEFMFMGFKEIEVIGTSFFNPAKAQTNLQEATAKIEALRRKWYGL